MCFCLHLCKEFPAQDGTDLHVCLLPGAGVPAHHHGVLTQCLQGAFELFSVTAFSKPCPLHLCLNLPLLFLALSPDLSPAVLPSEGVHLPRLPPRPGQRLRHDPKHDATDAARPVLSRLQQGPMRSKQHLYVEYVPTCTKASILCTHIYRQVPRAPLYNALRTHTVLTHGQMYIAYTAIYVYNHSYTNNLSRH